MNPTQTIATIIANGITFDPKNWGKPMTDTTAINDLFQLLQSRQVPYLLVGGVAMLVYVEGRNTQDIDLLIAPADLAKLPELQVSSQDRNFARATFNQVQIDLLLTSNALFAHAMNAYRSEVQLGDRTVQCITPEGLIVLKLYALPSLYRQGQFQRANLYEGDITALLLSFDTNVDALIALLMPHLIASDVVEVRQIVQDIKQRVVRMKNQG